MPRPSVRNFRPRLEALEDRTLLSPGDLDPTFGVGGKVITDFSPASAVADSIAVQPDGRIVATGYILTSSGQQFVLARYNSNGTVDMSFGSSGKVTTSFGDEYATARSVALQPDGRILAAGFTGTNGNTRLALARYTSSGSLDTSFGGTGTVTTSFGATNAGAK